MKSLLLYLKPIELGQELQEKKSKHKYTVTCISKYTITVVGSTRWDGFPEDILKFFNYL